MKEKGLTVTMSLAAMLANSGNAQDKPAKDETVKRPNIIFFLTDDHGYCDSEPYGNTVVKTPNMNRLEKESMLLTNAFSASPLCAPSRCCIGTGLLPHRNGGHFFGMRTKLGVRDMPDYLKDLGYHTTGFGKLGYAKHFANGNRKAGNVVFDYSKLGNRSIRLEGDEQHVADYILNYKEDAPLFMHIGVSPPHLPWVKNTKYDPAKIEMPKNYVDTKETRLALADYYTDVTVMDTMLGTILDAIEKRGIKENTIFIFTSDQGAHLPFGKWCVSDCGLRVPFMVRWPGHIKAGSRSDALSSLTDILPTMIEGAGGKIPDGFDGKSLIPLLTGKTTKHHEIVFGSHSGNKNGPPTNHNDYPMRTVRNKRYRYIANLYPERLFNTPIRVSDYWKTWIKRAKTDSFAKEMINVYERRPAVELYDMEKDPFAMKNLANNPEYAELQKKMRSQLLEWCKQQKDSVGVEQILK